MSEEIRIGCYVCSWGINIGGTVNIEEVAEFVKTLPNVVLAKTSAFSCSEPGQEMIAEDIVNHSLNRIVVGACTPKIHEPTYRALVESAGLSQYYFQMVNLREHVSFVNPTTNEDATEKAKALMAAGIERALLLDDVPMKEIDVIKEVLVVGAGIGGISAALAIANAGYKVYLVDSLSSIGGKMAQLDRVFPTDDCAIWILAPKMVEAGRHPNIELLTYCEIKDIRGSAGQYEVTIEHKPTYVDWEKCTGCGRCLEKCPILVPNEFNYGLGTRKAINILHPNAVPKKAYIDMDNCIKCKQCQKNCLAGAVDYEMETYYTDHKVGSIVITTGYEVYDVAKHGDFGYGNYYNVLTQIELERLISPTGPTGGHLYRISDGKPPKKIAMIQCVGSRDMKTNAYCSGGVCCLVAMKNAQLLIQEYGDIEVWIFYIDIRTTSKDEEEYYSRIRGEYPQIKFVKGKIAEIREIPESKNLLLRGEDVIRGKIIREEFDLVVLSTAMVPHPKTKIVVDLVGLDKAPSGFLKEIHTCLNPVETKASGVYIGGTARNPMAVPYTVSTARAAAAMAIDFVSAGKFRLELVNPIVDSVLCIGCGTCERNCSFSAIKVGDDGVAHVDEIACKGCGICASSCPVRAISFRYYRDEQLLNEIDAVIK